MAVHARVSSVTAYAESVIDGSVLAGKLVRQACERHVRDLETGASRGLHFDEDAADRAIDFFAFLKQSKGEWAGHGLDLEPWQQFIVGSIFGWKRADGLRRFRIAYIEVPRKNGKSTMSAGVGLYLLVADGEPGAEIFTAATHRDQARIVHEEAVAMVKASEALRTRVVAFRDNLHVDATRSKYEPLGADADTMDGLNVHAAIIDELHAHKTRALWDVLDTATGARRQPLIWAITTAGFDRHSICFEQRQYGCQILDQVIEVDTVFAYIATIDDTDDWQDPVAWAKANPNLGVSVKLDDLERKAEKAKELPSAQNAFKRLHLDVWTEQDTRWLTMESWAACKGEIDLEALRGRSAFGGLDLSSTTDLSAFVMMFPMDDGTIQVRSHFWLPEASIEQRVRRDRVPYDLWARQGFITLTPGNVIDYQYIRAQVNEAAATYRIERCGYDPFNATSLVIELGQDGLDMVPVRQGFLSLNAPTKELEKRIVGRTLVHDGNPVLAWMVSNVAVETDAAGNIKPSKAKSRERIDGVSGMVIALDQLTRGGGESTYERSSLLVL